MTFSLDAQSALNDENLTDRQTDINGAFGSKQFKKTNPAKKFLFFTNARRINFVKTSASKVRKCGKLKKYLFVSINENTRASEINSSVNFTKNPPYNFVIAQTEIMMFDFHTDWK